MRGFGSAAVAVAAFGAAAASAYFLAGPFEDLADPFPFEDPAASAGRRNGTSCLESIHQLHLTAEVTYAAVAIVLDFAAALNRSHMTRSASTLDSSRHHSHTLVMIASLAADHCYAVPSVDSASYYESAVENRSQSCPNAIVRRTYGYPVDPGFASVNAGAFGFDSDSAADTKRVATAYLMVFD